MARGIQSNVNNHNGVTQSATLDVTEPETMVQVEVDHDRGVLYVSLEGYTILRICRAKFEVSVKRDGVTSINPKDWTMTAKAP